MEVFKKSGTKERLFEMMERVNKVTINEDKWIQKAVKKPGALSKRLGIPEEDDIPMERINKEIKKLDDKYPDGEKMSADDREFKRQLEFAKTMKTKVNESFDSPKSKDEKYLDKTVGQDDDQVSKYDDGVRYPVEKELKTKDDSLEGLKGDDLPFKKKA